MLAQPHRLRSSADLRHVMRRGRRVSSPHLVLHIHTRPESVTPRAGFVVGKVVGNAVARNRVLRQLRHLIAHEITTFPPGTDIVLRGLAGAHGADLAAEVERLLTKAGLRA